MALILKTSPVGVDIPIANLQKDLFSKLPWETAVGSKGYQVFPRVNKNESKEGKLPEFFLKDNEYIEVFTDDKFTATSFFLVSDNRPVNEWIESDVDIIFQVNLKEAYPAITEHRADEEAHADVYNALKHNAYSANITNIVIGISNVYSDLRIDQVQFDDMEPYHVFKLSLRVLHDMAC